MHIYTVLYWKVVTFCYVTDIITTTTTILYVLYWSNWTTTICMHYYCTIELQEILSPVGRGHWLMPLIHGSFQQVRACCCLCVLFTLYTLHCSFSLSLCTALSLCTLCTALSLSLCIILHSCATLHLIYTLCTVYYSSSTPPMWYNTILIWLLSSYHCNTILLLRNASLCSENASIW